jgi:uncharacterized protein YqgC (DUF456 family)
MDTLVLAIAIILIMIGIGGTLLPLIPGIPLIFVSIAAYGWYEGFHLITPRYLVVMAGLTVLSLVADYLATALGAKFYGSSRAGIIGAVLGGIFGLFIFPPLGILVGPWVGAVAGELTQGKKWESALQSGAGSIIGLFSGIALKVILGIVMLASFLVVIF